MPTIERSAGLPVTFGNLCYGMAGGGYSGATDKLDATVARAAEVLRNTYGMDIEIRFNSDRESGGAWLKTPGTTDVKIGASVVTESRVVRFARAVERYGPDDEHFATTRLAKLRADVGKVTVDVYLSARVASAWCDGASYRVVAVDSIEEGLALCLAHADLSLLAPSV